MNSKLIAKSQLVKFARRLHRTGKRIVFTNGVFDILHAGHVDYLERAKRHGDVLVIGLNTDASVKVNKGDHRPIIPYKDRAKLLAALSVVDYIVPLERKTPDRLIETICPHVLVKGAQYKLGEIVGADFVRAHGGKIVRMRMVPGLSTTAIIKKVRALPSS
ncbi:MAG: D-glycero-beta-D-manno-heptose 1-phosphate adenylyltransferase [candidate division Zixibacteria bacterium]|nr:D-glycero-beta-D-manno-heptose 1-phosphate adenylyltransferase [candidate division Zixibacteria bacterium]